MKPRWSCFLISGLVAAALAVVGKVAFNLGQNQSYVGGIVGPILLIPGEMFAGLWAMVFSPQGGHGISDYAWMFVPVSWLVYFAVGAMICRSRAQK